jgi:putative transposase
MKHTKTLQVRVKDKHAKHLSAMARSVNFVFNYVNDLSHRSIKEHGRFLSAYDLHPFTKGAGKELGLHSQTLQCIAGEYVTRRTQFKKAKLNWRTSRGARRSLGWVPINTGQAKWKNGQVFHNGAYFGVCDSYGLSQYTFRSSSFSEDSRGRWYFNVVVDAESKDSKATASVGIDLGCKEAVTCSDGTKEKGRWYLHKLSRKLVDDNAAIFVGNVSSLNLAKTKMAKSVFDASWGMFKTMLKYKCDHAGIVFEEINEAHTTVTCSGCKKRTGPKGLEGLRIRDWTCSACGDTHDRDVNAAKNILALGHERLAVGIPFL